MSTMITGLFDNEMSAARAIRDLEMAGFGAPDISIVASENVNREAFVVDSHSKMPEGAAIGAGTGGAIGALVAGLTAVGAIATGGVGVLVAGPIVAALAGAGAGAAAGGVIGGAVGAAIPEHEVKHVNDAIERGSVLVGVLCENSDDRDRAKDTLKRANATRISHA